MRTETVEIAGREYVVEELGIHGNPAWRRELQEALLPFGDVIEQSQHMDVVLGEAQNVMSVMRRAADLLIEAPEKMVELVFSYSPAIAADRDHVMSHGYESEIMEAFTATLKLAFPFGRVISKLSPALNGSGIPTEQPTSKKSRSRNGRKK